MSKKVEELAIELRNQSVDFDGKDSPADVICAILEQQISELEDYGKEISEKQESLQKKFIGHTIDDEDSTMEELSPVERKQAEFRDRIIGRWIENGK